MQTGKQGGVRQICIKYIDFLFEFMQNTMSPFDGIFTTNLIYRSDALRAKPWYHEVDMTKYVAYIVEELNHDNSTSSLIDPFAKIKTLLAKHEAELAAAEK